MPHIMLVDDDEDVREMSTSTLEQFGYRVTPAGTSAAALEMFLQSPGLFDLAIVDYGTTCEKGTQLAKRFRTVRRDLPVLLYTGRMDEGLLEEAGAAGIDRILCKPLLRDDLKRAVEELLTDKKLTPGRPDEGRSEETKAHPVVLLVDDDRTVRTFLAMSLKDLGCRILTAGDGEEALQVLHAKPSVDVMVTEVAMPAMSGLELLRNVRQTDGLRKLPVILCTVAIDVATKKNAVKYRCSSYLSKPVHPEFLFDQISGLLQQEVSRRDVEPEQS